MADGFPQVAADPYAWPFDGVWRARDTAVLLLGFQTGAMEQFGAGEAAEVAARLASAAVRAGIPVFATRRGAGAGTPVAHRRQSFADAAPEIGSAGWKMVPALAALATAIFDHAGDNAFYGTGLEARLRQEGRRNLLIAGLPTDGLVHATMRAGNDMGFEALAVADACRGTTDARHVAQLRITTFGNGLFGAVAESAAVIAVLSAGTRSDA